MVIVWGSRMMGKCDVVPGLFHVATKFGHVYYLPLIPTASYVVLGQSGTSFRGVQVSLSFKSIMLAWLRVATFVLGLGCAIGALVVGLDEKHPGNWFPAAFMAVVFWVVCGMLCHAKFVMRASFARACQLAKELGLTEAGCEMISKAYGQPMPRGFAVKPAIPTPAIPVQRASVQRLAPGPIPFDDGPIPLEPPSAPAAKRPGAKQSGPIGLT